MKGFVLAILISLGLSFALRVRAAEFKAAEIIGIETFDGEVILARKASDKEEIAEGLNKGQRIEIKGFVIYPDEISEVLKRDLTIGKNVEKKPNQPDFN